MTEQARTPALLVFLASHLLISISDSATTGFFLGSLQISAWNPTVVLCADRSQSWRAVLKLHFQKQEERSHRNFPPVTVYLITSFFFFFFLPMQAFLNPSCLIQAVWAKNTSKMLTHLSSTKYQKPGYLKSISACLPLGRKCLQGFSLCTPKVHSTTALE